MREMKCPVCSGEVPRTRLRSETFPCPTCKERLRMRDFNPLLTIPVVACGYSLTFVIAYLMGLKGNGLFLVTIFLGCPASFLVAGVLGLLLSWVFCVPPRLERDPGADGLYILLPPGPWKGPK